MNTVKFFEDYGLVGIERKTNSQYMALCPNCKDKKREHFYFNSEGVYNCQKCEIKGNARTYLKEFAHITDAREIRKILHQYGLSDGTKKQRKIVATYDYDDLSGKLVHQTVRYDPKKFLQRRPDGKGGWVWNIKNIKRYCIGCQMS